VSSVPRATVRTLGLKSKKPKNLKTQKEIKNLTFLPALMETLVRVGTKPVRIWLSYIGAIRMNLVS